MTSQEKRQNTPTSNNNPEPKIITVQNRKDLLTNETIGRLFSKLAIPIAIGMLLNGLYNIVDAYFIAQYVGANAFAAVSAVFPFQMLIIAIGAFIANGVSILISQYWGAKRLIEAKQVINNALSVIIFVAIFFALISYLLTSEILSGLGLTPIILAEGKQYFIPISSGAILIMLLSLISDILRAQSNMSGLLLIILLGTFSNVLFDYIFIVVLQHGVFGAAIATLLGQSLGVILGLYLLSRNKVYFKLSTLGFSFDFRIIKRFILLGLPVFISYFGAAIIMIIINNSIVNQTRVDTEIILAAYGIIGRINILIILPLIAISHTCQTIVAHNFGANQHARVNKAGWVGMLVATIYLLVTSFIFFMFEQKIITFFTQDIKVISYTETIASTLFLMLPFAGITAIAVAFCQATGRAKIALILSSAKIYCLLIPLLFFISTQFSIHKIWYAFPVTECVTIALTTIMLLFYKGKMSRLSLSLQHSKR